MLLQVFYSVRSERTLMEQTCYDLLFRRFIGLAIKGAVWVPTVFSKHRERLIEHQAIIELFEQLLAIARENDYLSGEHFSVDGTRIQAWAGQNWPPRSRSGWAQTRGCDAKEFIEACVLMNVVPHVSQIAASVGYAVSVQKRKLIE